jgi:hypothetical protein
MVEHTRHRHHDARRHRRPRPTTQPALTQLVSDENPWRPRLRSRSDLLLGARTGHWTGQSVAVELTESAVVYDGLPISSGGAHALGRISVRDAFDAWHRFLESCTEGSPITCWFDFPATPGLAVDPELVGRVESAFAGGPGGRHPVPLDRVDTALSLFESLEPLPVNQWGMAPVWLWFTSEFRMRSPTSPDVWPGQDPGRFGEFQTPSGVLLGASSSRLILQAKRSIGLSLSIPEASDTDLAEIVPWLQAALPMRLSAKHWTRWTLTKNGRSYRGRKIAPVSA